MQFKRELPTLYGVDSKGKNRMWKCWVVGDTIFREHGLVNGKKILSERQFEGKSIGKKNETTPEEQAWMEANKEWVAHISKEYAPHPNDKEGQKLVNLMDNVTKKTGGSNVNAVAAISKETKVKNLSRKKEDTLMVDEIQGGAIIPMKAQPWELVDEADPYSVASKVAKYFSTTEGKGKSLVLKPTPFYGQWKLDGFRCRVMVQKDGIVMTSNSGKQFPHFSNLRKSISEWLENVDKTELLDGLDGELYAPQIIGTDGKALSDDARFSMISSICGLARSVPHELEDQLEFHCFDLFDKSGTIDQVARFKHRDNVFKKLPKTCKNIIKVETRILDAVRQVVEFHGESAEKGYEGVILRTFSLKYRPGTRSPELRKFKLFKDEEYEIVDCKVDKGVELQHFTWILKTEDGKEFSAKPMGTKEEKLEWYANRKSHIGKFITVKFQEFSDDGIPRFPIAKGFRSGKGTD